MVPARLYFCKLCSLAYDFQSTEGCGRSCTEHWAQPSKQGPEHRGCARAADKALRWSQGFSGRAPRLGSPGATGSNTFTLERPRSGGGADTSGTAPSARCCLWEQQAPQPWPGSSTRNPSLLIRLEKLSPWENTAHLGVRPGGAAAGCQP